MRALALLDNSVMQRVRTRREVAAAVSELVRDGFELCSSDVTRLEAGFSARSLHDHHRVVDQLTHEFRLLPLTSLCGALTTDLQASLFARGQGRAAGVLDLLHAATAIVHGAVVIHYDEDFEILADVDDRLRHRWVVPQGSVD